MLILGQDSGQASMPNFDSDDSDNEIMGRVGQPKPKLTVTLKYYTKQVVKAMGLKEDSAEPEVIESIKNHYVSDNPVSDAAVATLRQHGLSRKANKLTSYTRLKTFCAQIEGSFPFTGREVQLLIPLISKTFPAIVTQDVAASKAREETLKHHLKSWKETHRVPALQSFSKVERDAYMEYLVVATAGQLGGMWKTLKASEHAYVCDFLRTNTELHSLYFTGNSAAGGGADGNPKSEDYAVRWCLEKFRLCAMDSSCFPGVVDPAYNSKSCPRAMQIWLDLIWRYCKQIHAESSTNGIMIAYKAVVQGLVCKSALDAAIRNKKLKTDKKVEAAEGSSELFFFTGTWDLKKMYKILDQYLKTANCAKNDVWTIENHLELIYNSGFKSPSKTKVKVKMGKPTVEYIQTPKPHSDEDGGDADPEAKKPGLSGGGDNPPGQTDSQIPQKEAKKETPGHAKGDDDDSKASRTPPPPSDLEPADRARQYTEEQMKKANSVSHSNIGLSPIAGERDHDLPDFPMSPDDSKIDAENEVVNVVDDSLQSQRRFKDGPQAQVDQHVLGGPNHGEGSLPNPLVNLMPTFAANYGKDGESLQDVYGTLQNYGAAMQQQQQWQAQMATMMQQQFQSQMAMQNVPPSKQCGFEGMLGCPPLINYPLCSGQQQFPHFQSHGPFSWYGQCNQSHQPFARHGFHQQNVNPQQSLFNSQQAGDAAARQQQSAGYNARPQQGWFERSQQQQQPYPAFQFQGVLPINSALDASSNSLRGPMAPTSSNSMLEGRNASNTFVSTGNRSWFAHFIDDNYEDDAEKRASKKRKTDASVFGEECGDDSFSGFGSIDASAVGIVRQSVVEKTVLIENYDPPASSINYGNRNCEPQSAFAEPSVSVSGSPVDESVNLSHPPIARSESLEAASDNREDGKAESDIDVGVERHVEQKLEQEAGVSRHDSIDEISVVGSEDAAAMYEDMCSSDDCDDAKKNAKSEAANASTPVANRAADQKPMSEEQRASQLLKTLERREREFFHKTTITPKSSAATTVKVDVAFRDPFAHFKGEAERKATSDLVLCAADVQTLMQISHQGLPCLSTLRNMELLLTKLKQAGFKLESGLMDWAKGYAQVLEGLGPSYDLQGNVNVPAVFDATRVIVALLLKYRCYGTSRTKIQDALDAAVQGLSFPWEDVMKKLSITFGDILQKLSTKTKLKAESVGYLKYIRWIAGWDVKKLVNYAPEEKQDGNNKTNAAQPSKQKVNKLDDGKKNKKQAAQRKKKAQEPEEDGQNAAVGVTADLTLKHLESRVKLFHEHVKLLAATINAVEDAQQDQDFKSVNTSSFWKKAKKRIGKELVNGKCWHTDKQRLDTVLFKNQIGVDGKTFFYSMPHISKIAKAIKDKQQGASAIVSREQDFPTAFHHWLDVHDPFEDLITQKKIPMLGGDCGFSSSSKDGVSSEGIKVRI